MAVSNFGELSDEEILRIARSDRSTLQRICDVLNEEQKEKARRETQERWEAHNEEAAKQLEGASVEAVEIVDHGDTALYESSPACFLLKTSQGEFYAHNLRKRTL